jgi:hypothetical protein
VVGLAIRLQEIGDAELEEFVEQWLDRKAGRFVQVLRIGAANDKGRDVIGFLSDCRHEGPWELYQCKRKTRDKKLGVPEAMGELGKLFYHHVEGAYATLPTAYFFVAPRGVVGTLQDLLLNPSKIGPYLIGHWDQYCAEYITSTTVRLTPEIRTAIEGFDFNRVDYYAASRLAKDPDAGPALSVLLELPPGEAPPGETPVEIQQEELIYIDQLRQVYGEACGRAFRPRTKSWPTQIMGNICAFSARGFSRRPLLVDFTATTRPRVPSTCSERMSTTVFSRSTRKHLRSGLGGLKRLCCMPAPLRLRCSGG